MKILDNLLNARSQRKFQRAALSMNESMLKIRADLVDDTDEVFKQKALALRSKSASNEIERETAFAYFYEALHRTRGINAYPEQIMGAFALTEGAVAEMKTGEGKTFIGPFAAYLFALKGKPVHIVTTNSYLAKRDAMMLRSTFESLGFTVNYLSDQMSGEERQLAYQCDIVYATAADFGFDYLRDNMATTREHRVQRGLGYVIVDEVDSVLIDEARTPLIISGLSEPEESIFDCLIEVIDKLKVKDTRLDKYLNDGDGVLEELAIELDSKNHEVAITEFGFMQIESQLIKHDIIVDSGDLYKAKNQSILVLIQSLIKARYLYERDVHYLVDKENDAVVIIDEKTGRLMPTRRWSEGLHQAVEALEGITIKPETNTQSTITLVSFFELYEHLCGMSGTAMEEYENFRTLYGMPVFRIPTHRPVIREDQGDTMCLTREAMLAHAINEIEEYHKKGAPVLIGTQSVEMSEVISKLLEKRQLTHQVLNARHHAKEAEMIAHAGKPGVITVSTPMAGRGTDILLGGRPEDYTSEAEFMEAQAKVKALGGLHVVGIERGPSRRVDEQLQGRAGRQGDPGKSIFFCSLEDDMIARFGGDVMRNLLLKMGADDSEVYMNATVGKRIRAIQKRVEDAHMESRQNLLRFDSVMTMQRRFFFDMRNHVLESEMEQSEMRERVHEMIKADVANIFRHHVPENSIEEQWDTEGLVREIHEKYKLKLVNFDQYIEQQEVLSEDAVLDFVSNAVVGSTKAIEQRLDSFEFIDLMKLNARTLHLMLSIMDFNWQHHLTAIDDLRSGINLRAYANEKPFDAFTRDAYNMFAEMQEMIYSGIAQAYQMFIIERVQEANHIESMMKARPDESSEERQEDGLADK